MSADGFAIGATGVDATALSFHCACVRVAEKARRRYRHGRTALFVSLKG